ncbi:hypothetical protein GCM10010992_01160 [Cloacibacterium rupense]|uniref:Peptidase family M23 n=1 Tax=Cloacibacterium rupense TaxID=517423 RepID=A0ABQ2NG45_9FLAO|nr:hypothetical protein [Cloacibacterium rupense]GGP01277.1 hypothetical protein GCM10010992_01160 [Cloacibacterium rupense]
MQKKLIFIFLMIFLGFNLENAQTKNRIREEVVRDTIIINSHKWLSDARIFYSHIKYAPAYLVDYKDEKVFYITSKKDSIVSTPFEMKVLGLSDTPEMKSIILFDEKNSVSYTFYIINKYDSDFSQLNFSNFKVGEIAKEGTNIGILKNISKKDGELLYKYHPLMSYYDKVTNKKIDLYFYSHSENLIKQILDW